MSSSCRRCPKVCRSRCSRRCSPRGPIVASEVGEVGAALDHGRAGVLVPPGDAPALAAALDGLLASEDRARTLGRRARAARRGRIRPVPHGPPLSNHVRRTAGRRADAGAHAGGRPAPARSPRIRSLHQPPPRQLSTKATHETVQPQADVVPGLAAFAASYTLALQGNRSRITPANPSVLVGQTMRAHGERRGDAGGHRRRAHGTPASSTPISRFGAPGLNNQGEIGNNSYISVSEPALAIGTVNPAALRTGNEHTCTFVGDGAMQCWGTNYTGQLGDGTIGGFAMTPQFVHDIAGALKACTGGFHTCAILAGQHGSVLGPEPGRTDRQRRRHDRRDAAGRGRRPRTGPGPRRRRLSQLRADGRQQRPLLGAQRARPGRRRDDHQSDHHRHVVSGLTAAALSLGGYHSCAVLADATVQCWGESDFGQIGTAGLRLLKCARDDQRPLRRPVGLQRFPP